MANTYSPGGAIVFSLDFELHWGVRDITPVDGPYAPNLHGARVAVRELLRLFQAYGIAATWATVGILFADGRNELESYLPSRRRAYTHPRADPYREPLGTTEKEDPLHFAPSLIEEIRAHPRQELASHTFSHFHWLEGTPDPKAFAEDLRSARRIAKSQGIDLRSIVLPRNQMDQQCLTVLQQEGFTTYRGCRAGLIHDPHRYLSSTPLGRMGRLGEAYAGRPNSSLVSWGGIVEESGLCNVAASRFLRPWSPRLAGLESLRLARIRREVEEAARSRQIFHLWWHPHNFGTHLEENLDFLKKILELVSDLRDSGRLVSLSMGEAADVARSVASPTGPPKLTEPERRVEVVRTAPVKGGDGLYSRPPARKTSAWASFRKRVQ